MEDDFRDELHNVICPKDNRICELEDCIHKLQQEIQELNMSPTPCHRKMAHHTSPSPSRSPSWYQPSLTRSRSLMWEDQELHPLPPSAAPWQLIDRFSRPPSSVTIFSPASLAGPSHMSSSLAPITGQPLSLGDHQLSHEPAFAGLHNDDPMLPPAVSFAPSPFYPSVGFHSLPPVLFMGPNWAYTITHGSCCLKPDGTIDLAAHAHIIWAVGELSPNGPSWSTILLRKDQLDNKPAHTAIHASIPIPLSKIPPGGRNSMLYSPIHDLTNKASLNHLFTLADRLTHAHRYVKRIQLTPPELRSEFHSLALARWDSMQEANPAGRQHSSGPAVKRPEPLPSVPDFTWKRWLRDRWELHGQLCYIGIPFDGQGYQRLHLEGMKALLTFLPLNNRGTCIRLGSLRDAFLCHTTVLLAIPERYRQQLVVLGVVVSIEQRATLYTKADFAVASRIGVNDLVQFLALASVQPEEAE